MINEPSFFEELWDSVKDLTLLNKYKAQLISDLFIRSTHRFFGVFREGITTLHTAEFGVFRGGITALLGFLHQSDYLSQKGSIFNSQTWAFDSFQGLPPDSGPNDTGHYQTGHMIHSEVAFRNTISSKGLDQYVKVVPGFFKESTKNNTDLENTSFKLVHFDADLYESTKDALCSIYDRVVPGGFLIFDDYFDQGGGIANAVNEHIQATGEMLFAGYGDQVIIVKGLLGLHKNDSSYSNRLKPPYTPALYSKDLESRLHKTLDGVLIDMTIPMSNDQYKRELWNGQLTPELGPGSLNTRKMIAERILNLVDFHFAVLGVKNES